MSREIPNIENDNVESVNNQSKEIPSTKNVNFSYRFLPHERGFKFAVLNVNK